MTNENEITNSDPDSPSTLIDETIAGDWETSLQELGQPIDKHDPLVHRSRRRWEAKKTQMRAMLPPHGCLILGAAENLYGISASFESRRVGDTLVYRPS